MAQRIEYGKPDVVGAFRWWEIKQLRNATRPQDRRDG